MSAEHTAIAALLGMTGEGSSTVVLQRPDASATMFASKRKAPDTAAWGCEPPGTNSTQLLACSDLFNQHETKQSKKRKKTKVHCIEPSFPVAPRVVQVCKMPKTHVDHSYRDLSSVPCELGYLHPTDIEDMTFSQKLHDVLSRPEYAGMITWQQHGRAFRVIVPRQLEQQRVLNRYFGHNRYSTFLSQLKNYGFKPLTKGQDKNCFYHEFMLRGLPHLCKYMPAFKEGRKLIPDGDNEPDLTTISMLWPVPQSNPRAPTVAAPVAAAAPTTAPSADLSSFMASGSSHFERPSEGFDLTASSLAALFGVQHETPRNPIVTSENSIAAVLSQANFAAPTSVVSEANVNSILSRANFQAPSRAPLPQVQSAPAPQQPASNANGGLTTATLAALLGQGDLSELLKYL